MNINRINNNLQFVDEILLILESPEKLQEMPNNKQEKSECSFKYELK